MLEYEPAAQGVHVELLFAPVALEYVPLAHGLHVEEPLAEKVPAGQGLHEVGPPVLCPVVGQNPDNPFTVTPEQHTPASSECTQS